MKSGRRTLPLGIDIGCTRVRVALAVWDDGGAQIAAVATRDLSTGSATSGEISESGYVAALIEDAVAELRTKERRCTCAIGEPDATLQAIKLPRMTSIERARVARFEAQRCVDYPIDEATVRVHPLEESAGLFALGVARTSVLASRVHALRSAGLRPVAMEHDALALRRVLPDHDAVVDLGYERASVHTFAAGSVSTLQLFGGGREITRAIARELAIDDGSAEKRKRILGTAGAGERARSRQATELAMLLTTATIARSGGLRVALVGNGARLGGLAAQIESACGAAIEVPVGRGLRSDGYPEDVLRSGAPDWSLAAGLALASVSAA